MNSIYDQFVSKWAMTPTLASLLAVSI